MIDHTLLTNPGIQVVAILVGVVVLIAGRQLFWLFVGAVGFVVGLSLAFQLLADQPPWLILLAAVLLGLVGIVVAVFLQTIAVGLAGFLMGGYALTWLGQQFSLDLSQWGWLIFVVGGVMGVLLAIYLFDAALIILSALAGASLIVQAISLDPLVTVILFLVLVLLGILIQTSTRRAKPPADPNSD
ncbi:MAG: DUF4203 domain-containing protein [Anaerolineales bacterium]|nr:DUF4203 domain-containing protein [Anaerolineales bacterium]